MARPLRARIARGAAALLAGLVAAVLLAELGLRFVLHGDSAPAFAHGLRRPEWFADGDADDDFWKLLYLFAAPEKRSPPPGPDPVLGWTGYLIEPGTYTHRDEGTVLERRPVLLYGDSFAQCNTPAEQCFPALLAESDLAATHTLVNYGVGGYGLDQIGLLLERTIDRWSERDPLVVVSLLVESDLDRSFLSLRDWPKPRLRLVDGELRSAPVVTDVGAYIAADPVRIRSYLWRFLAYKPGFVPDGIQRLMRGDHRHVAEKQALNRAILEKIHRELSARGLEHFVLLFHAENALAPQEWAEWQEPFVRDVCAEIGMPLISVRPFLLAAAGGDPAECARFYGHSGVTAGHLNAIGNAVAFAALREGIEGRAGAPDTDRITRERREGLLEQRFTRVSRRELLGREAEVEERGVAPLLREESGPAGLRLWLRGGELGPTRVRLQADGAATLRLRASAVSRPGVVCHGGAPWLVLELDGVEALRTSLLPGSGEVSVEVPIGGAREVGLVVGYDGPDADCAWVSLQDPRWH